MQRWRRGRNDRAATTSPGSAAEPDGAGSEDHLPPLRLDLSNDDADTSDVPMVQGHGGQPWWRWAGFGMALLVGAVGGVIGTNARHDAEEQARIELIGGHVGIEAARADGRPAQSWVAEFVIFNSGQQDVEVTGFELDGWTMAENDEPTEPTEPTIAGPGTWTSISTHITPDCETEPPSVESSGSFTAAAAVRTGGEETSVPVTFGRASPSPDDVWNFSCSDGEARYPDLFVEVTTVVSSDASGDTLQTLLRLELVQPSPRSGLTGSAPTQEAAVVQMRTTDPGLEATTVNLPIELSQNDPGGAEAIVEWTITSCTKLEDLDRVLLNLHVTTEVGSPSASMQSVPVPDQVLIELGRLSAQTCGL